MNALTYIMFVTETDGLELANKLGVNHTLISHWRSNKRPIPEKIAKQLEYIFKVPTHYILKENLTGEDRINIEILIGARSEGFDLAVKFANLQKNYSSLLELHTKTVQEHKEFKTNLVEFING